MQGVGARAHQYLGGAGGEHHIQVIIQFQQDVGAAKGQGDEAVPLAVGHDIPEMFNPFRMMKRPSINGKPADFRRWPHAVA